MNLSPEPLDGPMEEGRFKRRRNSLEIMSEMLEAAEQGSRKTTIMFKANLSYALLVQYLSVLKGYEVAVIDDVSSGQLENLSDVWQSRRLHFTFGDIRNPEMVKICLRDVETVVHLAALTSVKKSMHEPLATHDVNVSGTLALLKASSEARVRKFVFAS